MNRYISLVGVELEGCWRRISQNTPIHTDLSVRRMDGFSHTGEIASPPMEAEKIPTWILLHAPEGVNETCGFHIHVSLIKSSDYYRLTSIRFYQLLLKKIEEWGNKEDIPKTHHFWKRLAGTFKYMTPGGNVRNFCRKEFLPEQQLAEIKKGGEGSARHCHLNFCYKLHGTVELRLFPAWENLNLYASSVNVFLETIEEFLWAEKIRRNNMLRMKISFQKPKLKLRHLNKISPFDSGTGSVTSVRIF